MIQRDRCLFCTGRWCASWTWRRRGCSRRCNSCSMLVYLPACTATHAHGQPCCPQRNTRDVPLSKCVHCPIPLAASAWMWSRVRSDRVACAQLFPSLSREGRVRVSDYRLWSIANNVSYFTLDQPSTEPCRYQKHFRDCGNMTVIPSTVARALSEALDRIGL